MKRKIVSTLLGICCLVLSLAMLNTGLAMHVDAASRPAHVYYVGDNSYNLDSYFTWAKNANKTELWLGADLFLSSDQATTVDASFTKIMGFRESFFGNEARVAQLKSANAAVAHLVVPSGANIIFENVNFVYMDANRKVQVEIQEGATVLFKNCSFGETVLNAGEATFENVVFDSSKRSSAEGPVKIDQRGTGKSYFTGSTVAPEIIGGEVSNFQPLEARVLYTKEGDAANAREDYLPSVVTHAAYDETLVIELTGTNAALANLQATLSENTGLTASVNKLDENRHRIQLQGTAGEKQVVDFVLTITITEDQAKKIKAESITKKIQFEIYQPFEVLLKGRLQAYVSEDPAYNVSSAQLRHSSKAHGVVLLSNPLQFLQRLTSSKTSGSYQPDAVSMATGGGGGAASGGANTANNSLELVMVEDGNEIDAYDFQNKYSNTNVHFEITPEGSGMKANLVQNKVYLSGHPAKPGSYKLTAIAEQGVRTARSAPVSFRIYPQGLTFKAKVEVLPKSVQTWEVEPYNFPVSESFDWPANIQKVLGSDTSGTYATVGNAKSMATEIITIPEGADVTFTNMKFLRSVKFVVNKGAKLTLDDSVTYGPIEVNGGTFSMRNSASLVNTLTLNDGSVLENATIKSHARHLTDGPDIVPDKPILVTVNGNVTVKGENTILADSGDASKPGQTGLVVAGNLVIEDGAKLKVTGGGDPLALYAVQGGTAVQLNGGSISGPGTLESIGGVGHERGGDGLSGTGTVEIANLIVQGGDGGGTLKDEVNVPDSRFKYGGRAIVANPDLKIHVPDASVQNGRSNTALKSEVEKSAVAEQLNGVLLYNWKKPDAPIVIQPDLKPETQPTVLPKDKEGGLRTQFALNQVESKTDVQILGAKDRIPQTGEKRSSSIFYLLLLSGTLLSILSRKQRLHKN